MASAVSLYRAARLSEFSADTQHVAPARLTQGILMEASFRFFRLCGFLRARMIMFARTISIASQGIGAEKAKLALSPAIASP